MSITAIIDSAGPYDPQGGIVSSLAFIDVYARGDAISFQSMKYGLVGIELNGAGPTPMTVTLTDLGDGVLDVYFS